MGRVSKGRSGYGARGGVLSGLAVGPCRKRCVRGWVACPENIVESCFPYGKARTALSAGDVEGGDGHDHGARARTVGVVVARRYGGICHGIADVDADVCCGTAVSVRRDSAEQEARLQRDEAGVRADDAPGDRLSRGLAGQK